MSEAKIHRTIEKNKNALRECQTTEQTLQDNIRAGHRQLSQLHQDRHDAMLAKIVGTYVMLDEGYYVHVLSRKKRKGRYIYICTTIRFGKKFAKVPYYEIATNVEMSNFFRPKTITEDKFNREWNKIITAFER